MTTEITPVQIPHSHLNRMRLALYCFTAALGGLLFGFDTIVINGTIPFIRQSFQMTESMVGWTVASALIGCVIGALVIGKPGDTYGRKAMLKVTAVLFAVSALGTGFALSLSMLVIFRFIGGLAIGGASVMAPMYISEISPAHLRGRLVAIAQLAIVIGALMSFFVNFLVADMGINSWRYMFLAGGVPAVFFFFLLFLVVQSPRWLVSVGRIEEARTVIQEINGPGANVDHEIADIVNSLQREGRSVKAPLFKAPYLRLVLIGIAVGMFNQLTGINTVMYYSTDILMNAGLAGKAAIATAAGGVPDVVAAAAEVRSALKQSVFIGGTNVVMTLVGMALIDFVGRRRLLLVGSLGMSAVLGVFSWAFFTNHTQGYLPLGILICFQIFFAASQGVTIWVLLAEMFPNAIRARGSSIGSFSHWFFNALFSYLFPVVAHAFGVGYCFMFYSICTLISFFFFKNFLMETKRQSLEELELKVLAH
jgi:MFS family permease